MRMSYAIDLGASAEAIWNTLLDFDHYKDWNPFIPYAASEDRRVVAMHLDPGANERLIGFSAKIITLSAPHAIVAALDYGPPFFGGGRYSLTLTPQTSGTRLEHALMLRGVSRRFGETVKDGLAAMDKALAQKLAAAAKASAA